ncbi:protein of unknown function [Virgibacillus subterraneus]|uniref:IrrE N-terminal-like domain-containing protein n=1 Tax=Virgibacillus subterraneus TaxID=621109 RepID=A0A1H9KLV6_9BACI|nr:ImmA/IrrE family metallo-endopeptidase [Virgibacillus subterraneus]SER00151.1 protein of unknown function [Virgibacillus subterraneus]
MSSYVAEPTSRKKIRQVVSIFRDTFGLVDDMLFPVVHFLEIGLSEINKKFNYEVVSIEEMPDDYAVTYPEEHKIVIREDVYDRAVSGVARDRFTIAHEIGHYIMHRPDFIALARNDGKQKVPAYKDPEWQANTFAGELLAPPNIISGLSASEISKKCGVSSAVAEIQLNNL